MYFAIIMNCFAKGINVRKVDILSLYMYDSGIQGVYHPVVHGNAPTILVFFKMFKTFRELECKLSLLAINQRYIYPDICS